MLQRSTFCAVLPGNGWGHIEEPVIQGCIPVLIMPGIHAQLEDVIDISRYAVRVARHELPDLLDRLRAISPREVRRMQAELRAVWERYTYSGLFKREYRLQIAASKLPKAARRRLASRLGTPSQQGKHSFAPLEPRLSGVDAVDSLIALLRRRLRRPGMTVADQLVSHGPIATPLPPIPGYRPPDTAGVQ